MKHTPVCVLMMALALVGGGQTALAGSELHDERDFPVDHAIGGLKKGSRMLAPEGRSTATSPSRSTQPGGAISPKDAGGLTGGSRGTGAANFGGGTPATGGVGAQGGGGTGGGAGASATEAPSGGGGTGTETSTGIIEEPSGGGSETVSEPSATTDTGTSNDLIELDVDVDTATGGGSADLSVGGEPVAETDVSTGTDLSGTTDTVTADTGAALDVDVVTDTTTIDASTETTEGNLTIDVSAGSDTLGDALLGTGSELDPDATTAEETTDILEDCSILDPLSLPEHCL